MATRAEMEAELKTLRAKMEELDELESELEAERAARREAEAEAEAAAGPVDEARQEASQPAPRRNGTPRGEPRRSAEQELRDEFDRLLAENGVPVEEIETLAKDFVSELEDISKNRPLVTAAAAFGLGFMLGRMTK